MDTHGTYQLQGERTLGSTFRNLKNRQLQKSVLKRHSVPQIFSEKMNLRAQELGKSWRGFMTDQSHDVTDYTHLYESEDRLAIRKAMRKLEQDKKQAVEAK